MVLSSLVSSYSALAKQIFVPLELGIFLSLGKPAYKVMFRANEGVYKAP